MKDGDEVVIYNAGNGKAVPAVMKGSFYLDGVDVVPADGKITTEDATIVWKVTKNADGSYTFANGEKVLSINWSTDVSKTSISLDGANPKLTLETCNEANHSYYIYSATQKGNNEHIYLEWFAKYTEFSAYDTGAEKLTEKDFGFQFYVKGAGAPQPTTPTESSAPAESSEATEPDETRGGSYVKVDVKELTKDDEIIIVAKHDGKYYAMTNSVDGSNAVEVTVSGDNCIPVATACRWKVCAGTAEGTYTLQNRQGEFLAKAATGSNIELGETGTDLTPGKYGFCFSSETEERASRWLVFKMNSGEPRFRAYAASNTGSDYSFEISFYKLDKE